MISIAFYNTIKNQYIYIFRLRVCPIYNLYRYQLLSNSHYCDEISDSLAEGFYFYRYSQLIYWYGDNRTNLIALSFDSKVLSYSYVEQNTIISIAINKNMANITHIKVTTLRKTFLFHRLFLSLALHKM